MMEVNQSSSIRRREEEARDHRREIRAALVDELKKEISLPPRELSKRLGIGISMVSLIAMSSPMYFHCHRSDSRIERIELHHHLQQQQQVTT